LLTVSAILLRDLGSILRAIFAKGFVNDLAAARHSIVSPWSNREAEGQSTKLELVKRQAKFNLIEIKRIAAAR